MPKWSVTLNGDRADLKALADLGVGVTEEGDACVFHSPELDALTDPHAVYQRTVEWVEVFNGLSRIAGRDVKGRMISVGGIVRTDGNTRATFMIPGTGELKVQGSDLGTRPFAAWVALAAREASVARALRFFAAPVTSFSLWNVYEVIREDAGGTKTDIVNKGLANDPDIERFRGVHYPSALGDKARHAVQPKLQPAPTNPMSLAEAQEFITHLLEKWLASK